LVKVEIKASVLCIVRDIINYPTAFTL
jgi:hypothetical protein